MTKTNFYQKLKVAVGLATPEPPAEVSEPIDTDSRLDNATYYRRDRIVLRTEQRPTGPYQVFGWTSWKRITEQEYSSEYLDSAYIGKRQYKMRS